MTMKGISMVSLLFTVVAIVALGPNLAVCDESAAVQHQDVVTTSVVARFAPDGIAKKQQQLTLQLTLDSKSLIAAPTLDLSVKIKSASSTIPNYELQALKDLYDSTSGDDWVWTGKHWDFSDANANPCDPGNTWQGIYCNYNYDSGYYHVTGIVLDRCNLVGSLPDSLGQLSELTELVLFMNQLTGIIPSSLGQLTKVERLYLFSNQLTGPLPESIGNMTSMLFLLVSENSLDGTLPASLGQLSELITIGAEHNNFNGIIPKSLGDLPNLDELTLHHNQLDGIIPSSLCKYHHSHFYAWNNNFVCYPECLISDVTTLLVGNTPLCPTSPTTKPSTMYPTTKPSTISPTTKRPTTPTTPHTTSPKPSTKPTTSAPVHRPTERPTPPSFRPTKRQNKGSSTM